MIGCSINEHRSGLTWNVMNIWKVSVVEVQKKKEPPRRNSKESVQFMNYKAENFLGN